MTIAVLLKVLALVLWLIAFAWRRLGANNPVVNFDLVAAGLFFFFLPDIFHL